MSNSYPSPLMNPSTPPPPAPLDLFHLHLEACAQCRAHPFALCPVGRALLHEAATARDEKGGAQ